MDGDVDLRRSLFILSTKNPTSERDEGVETICEDQIVSVGTEGGETVEDPETYLG